MSICMILQMKNWAFSLINKYEQVCNYVQHCAHPVLLVSSDHTFSYALSSYNSLMLVPPKYQHLELSSFTKSAFLGNLIHS